jgi:transposase
MEQLSAMKTGEVRKTAPQVGKLKVPRFTRLGEAEARAFFLKCRWRGRGESCPRCGAKEVERVRRNRLLCHHCRYEFGDFTGTYLGLLHVCCRDWYVLVWLFDLEFPARQAAAVMGLSYPTVLKGFHIIRQAIAAQDRDFPVPGKPWGAGAAPGAQANVMVLGIREQEGRVRVEAVPNLTAAALLRLKAHRLGRSHIACATSYQGYDCLFFCAPGPGRAGKNGPRSPRKVYLGEQQGFRAYARQRLVRYHGVSGERFPFYMKELEFRYNHRGNARRSAIIGCYLTRPVAHLL